MTTEEDRGPVTHPRRPPIVLPTGVYVLGFRVLSRGYAALGGIVLGAGLIAGGPGRFSSRALATAREVPGQQATWGAAAAGIGAVMLAASLLRLRQLVATASVALAAWHLFFAVSLGLSAVHDPQAGVSGAITYTGLAGLGCVLAAAIREAERP